MKTSRGSDDSLRCSFCHKSQDAVAKLISSPSDYPRAYICDECVGVCNSILEDDKSEAQPGTAPAHLLLRFHANDLGQAPLEGEPLEVTPRGLVLNRYETQIRFLRVSH